MENKKPMVRVHLQQPTDITVSEDGVVSQEIKHMVQWVNTRLDEDVIRSICKMARAEGVTDVTILDKEAIITALRKSSQEPPRLDENGFVSCPCCGKSVVNHWNARINPPHCMMCGQALDWN